MEELGLEMKIAALSALAALGSAYWAWSSARSARRALSIAELEARSRSESLRAELVNALRWAKGDVEYIAMACSFSNSSTLSTTIQRVELHVSGFDVHGEFSMLRLPPNGSSQRIQITLRSHCHSTSTSEARFLAGYLSSCRAIG